ADSDGSFVSFTLGENYYIYALQPTDGAEPDFVISINSTYPDGYTENNSRKIGGFHYGRIRDVADAYDETATITVNILPNSVWDLKNRPTCDPTGMAKVGDIWVDIYLTSHSSGSWPDQEVASEYNATPVTGTEGYCWYDFQRLFSNVGKRMLSYSEWIQAAYGSPEGNDNDNNAAWSNNSNSGRTATGTVEQAVSVHNIVDCAGNVWEWLDEFTYRNTGSTGFSWYDVLDAGKDSSNGQGETYMQNDVSLIAMRAGGRWIFGVNCGARAVYLGGRPWDVTTGTGCRGACDSL
ncbi:MAG: hypothetical protein K9K76_10750, partial [Halanaerobiales bacterium]|nr:hypothetical protein [Halanaerobiales bacterium]